MFTLTSNLIKEYPLLPAFNFGSVEVARAIVSACEEFNAPVILQTSQGEANFLTLEIAGTIAKAFGEKAKIPVALQLDHLKDLSLLKKEEVSNFGYSSVMLDVEGNDFGKSVSLISKVKKEQPKLFIEANLEFFDKIEEFVKKTGVDLLAPEKDNFVEIQTLREAKKQVKTPLVLHGCSKKTDDEIKEAVGLGIRKINFNTELRQSWVTAIKVTLEENPNYEKPYNILAPAEEAVKEVVKEKLRLLGFQ